MKKLLIILVIFMATINESVAANTLSERQLHLVTLASLEAQGDLDRLAPAINEALDGGVTINEIKEAFPNSMLTPVSLVRSMHWALYQRYSMLARRKERKMMKARHGSVQRFGTMPSWLSRKVLRPRPS